jgi:hypothetical protein
VKLRIVCTSDLALNSERQMSIAIRSNYIKENGMKCS